MLRRAVVLALGAALATACQADGDCPVAHLEELVLVNSPADLEPLRGVRTVDELRIYPASPLGNLEQLRCLEVVKEDLIISGAELTNLDDLSSLRSVGGQLGLYGLHSLTKISGLSSLAHAEGFSVIGAEALEDFDGMAALRTIGGSGLLLQDMGEVRTLDGLSGLEEIADELLIQGNPALERVTGTSSLHIVIGRIGFFDNPQLVPCDDYALVEQLDFVNQGPELQSDPADCAGS